MRKAPAAVLAVLGLLTVAGCDHAASGPSAGSFRAGTCRAAAGDVLALGRVAGRLGRGPTVDDSVMADLTRAQQGLRPVADGAEPALAPALSRLVTAAGLVRLQARVHSYHEEQGANLTAAYRGVLSLCTGRS